MSMRAYVVRCSWTLRCDCEHRTENSIGRPLMHYLGIRAQYLGIRAQLSVGRSRTVLSVVGALCMALYVSASVAQTTHLADTSDKSTSDVSTPSTGLEEIVVTAERRVGTVQSTPISITAISGEELQAQGISSVGELGAETPGISEHNSGPGQ